MPNKTQQKGYTLPEALVAAVIAAGIIASASVSISSSIRSVTKSSAATTSLMEAQNIATQLHAGLSVQSVQEDFINWKISQSHYRATKPQSSLEISLVEIKAIHQKNQFLSFSVIRLDKVARK